MQMACAVVHMRHLMSECLRAELIGYVRVLRRIDLCMS